MSIKFWINLASRSVTISDFEADTSTEVVYSWTYNACVSVTLQLHYDRESAKTHWLQWKYQNE